MVRVPPLLPVRLVPPAARGDFSYPARQENKVIYTTGTNVENLMSKKNRCKVFSVIEAYDPYYTSFFKVKFEMYISNNTTP